MCSRFVSSHGLAVRGYVELHIRAAQTSCLIPLHMTKKTPPRIGTTDKGNEDENYKYRYFGGFWELISETEIPYLGKKKQKSKRKKHNLKMLIELDTMSISWLQETLVMQYDL